jgi:adenosylcobinamide-GDP ribazoletransferase
MEPVPLRGLRAAASFLTRVPAGGGHEGPSDLARSLPWFPVVGALLGLALAGLYAGARLATPPFLGASLTLGVAMLLTGGFHEDGLADTADALGGGWNREESLRILKDPRHGTYGVLALVLSVLIRASALATLDGWAALAVLPAAHALSRGAAVGLLGWVKPASTEGLGATYFGFVTRGRALTAGAAAVLIAVAAMGLWGLPAGLLTVLGAAAVVRLAMRKLGGVTGDVLGAVQQAGEMLVLLLGAMAAFGSWPGIPWWRSA